MSPFKYADESIQSQDIMIAIPSVAIAVSILDLPGILAKSVRFADGWIAIIIAGILAVSLTWFVAKIVSKFPNQSFLSYSSSLLSKPVAYLLTILFAIQGMMIAAYEVSSISIISKQYLFDTTPVEVIGLSFLLIVVYSVSGSRVGLFRLNAMFLPLIFLVTGLLIIFAIGFMKLDNVLPVFTTGINGYVKGTIDSALAYAGIGILFFYIPLVKDINKVPGRAAFGMSWVVLLYLLIYLVCIAVFGQATTEVIRLPLIELAKSIKIPGGFFERMESLFFVIWITAIFTTAMMTYDVAVMALQSILPKLKKHTIVFGLSPLIYFISTLPNNFLENVKFEEYLAYTTSILPVFVVIPLWIMYGIKGGKNRGQ